jgi:coproporphyrinogen III oxidase-like Fe-S oxidoreductase
VDIDPRRVDIDKLKFYHACGVNRLSFGIQDFDEGVQKETNQKPALIC